MSENKTEQELWLEVLGKAKKNKEEGRVISSADFKEKLKKRKEALK